MFHQGFDYAGLVRWRPMFGMTIDGLKVTTIAGPSAFVEVKFWRGTEVLAVSIAPAMTLLPERRSRSSASPVTKPTDYDRLTINDMF